MNLHRGVGIAIAVGRGDRAIVARGLMKTQLDDWIPVYTGMTNLSITQKSPDFLPHNVSSRSLTCQYLNVRI